MDKAVSMVALREALEVSWQPDTAYLRVEEAGNPALGQCYPTARVLQFFFPDLEIIEGEVWTGERLEKHFWNMLRHDGQEYHIDFTWQQFPHDSVVKSYRLRDRETLNDSPATIKRVELLLERVRACLAKP